MKTKGNPRIGSNGVDAQKPLKKTQFLTPRIGLSDHTCKKMIEVLNRSLANTLVLYTKTRNYHWNVVGVDFIQFHKLFESQYEQLEEAIDEIAERVGQLGGLALGTLEEFRKNTILSEEPGQRPPALQMVENLLNDHECIICQLREDADLAEELGDMGSNDFLIGLIQNHEKMAWFLRTHLQPETEN